METKERLVIFRMSEGFTSLQRKREIGLDDIFFLESWFGETLSEVMCRHLQCGLGFCESALCIVLDQNLLTQKEQVARFNEWFADRLDI